MRVPTRQRQHGLQFNITPLIDVVFLLIIFFLAASHFVRSETREEVNLPEAEQTEDEQEESPQRLVVTVTADRKLHVGGTVIELAELEERIFSGMADADSDQRRFEVRIRGDRSVPYSEVEPIMLACARAGATRVKFSVIRGGR